MRDPAGFIEETLVEIWNRKQIGRIYDAYLHNTQLHTAHGRLYGREEVIRSVTSRMAGFPNLSYAVEDVIGTAEAQDAAKVAVRWMITGENSGYTEYGPPTGREITLTGISQFRVKGDRIVEQWEVDDELGLIRQLGFEPLELARSQKPDLLEETGSSLPGGSAFGGQLRGEVERVFGQTTPEVISPRTGGGFDVVDFIRRTRHEIWNWRLLGTIEDAYTEDAVFHGPSDRSIDDREGFTGFVLSLLGSFPDLAVFVDDVLWNGEGEERYRSSARWTLLGTHRGTGPYGRPSGKRVRAMGMTNSILRNGRVVEEWTELGEFAMLRQIQFSYKASNEPIEEMTAEKQATDAEGAETTEDESGKETTNE